MGCLNHCHLCDAYKNVEHACNQLKLEMLNGKMCTANYIIFISVQYYRTFDRNFDTLCLILIFVPEP